MHSMREDSTNIIRKGVAVTGMGCVCAAGQNPDAVLDSLEQGHRYLTPPELLDARALPFPFFAVDANCFPGGRRRSAKDTLALWSSVRDGEDKYIFPFQEEADSIFNTALLYETGVFKKYAEPLLMQIKPDVKEYADAQRLLSLLSYFPHIDDQNVPLNSIIREFIGGGSIHEDT